MTRGPYRSIKLFGTVAQPSMVGDGLRPKWPLSPVHIIEGTTLKPKVDLVEIMLAIAVISEVPQRRMTGTAAEEGPSSSSLPLEDHM